MIESNPELRLGSLMVFQTETFEEKEDTTEMIGRRLSFWGSLILATLVCFLYYFTNPPDDAASQKMRLFFKENAMAVMSFIQMPREEQKAYATKQKHPFYVMYLRASEIEKDKIRALIHKSVDYTPHQYWLNMVFQWLVWFSSFWFIGKVAEALLIVQRGRKPLPRKRAE
jgi:hypothetical protein